MIEIFFDGACEPVNPGGTASYGWLIKENGKIISSGYGIVGTGDGMTNNVAEYKGLIEGVKALLKLEIKGKIKILGDSNMVCNMVARKWGWKKKKWNPHPKFPHLKQLLEQVHSFLEKIDHEVKWIPREQNFESDELSKKGLIEIGIISAVAKSKPCQRCNGQLVKRKGRYGDFFGCSNYPKCRFTTKV